MEKFNTVKSTTEQSLRTKLKEIGNPRENEVLSIQLTPEEAILYGISENDIFSDEEMLLESEEINE